MRACCGRRFDSRELRGRKVAIVGAGHVGSALAKRLAKAGAKLILADIDQSKRELARELRARWTDPSSAMLAEVDVLAPCALGGVIDQVNVGLLRTKVVCGAANNQLAHEGLADDLAGRGILYAPDFIANAGGLINVSMELEGYDPKRVRERVEAIEETVGEILDEAETAGSTPLAAAHQLARRRLRRRIPSPG
jgi:leucine dehydrogenase